ncbi:MAG: aldo/keto reductase [Firmicutes bacterium]|nr:aldo/keto reductase [Bacillota bacterium]
MQYRKFGKLDWQVSALGFGAMRLPIKGGHDQIVEEEAIAMIRRAIDGGVNYIDTAWNYHDGKSEVVVGKALQDGYRARVKVATKAPIRLYKKQDDFDRFLDEQLQRLQLDCVDFYLLHGIDQDQWENIALKLDLLSRAEAALADGRIKHLGFSFHDKLPAFKQIIDGYDKWEFCQIQYNYMDIENQAGMEGLKYAAAKGLAVVIMEPLLGGKLANPPQEIAAVMREADPNRTPADWALQWLWSQPEISVVLSGMSTMQQVEENLTSAAKSGVNTFTAEEQAVIDEVRRKYMAKTQIPCTGCAYCTPCPQNVAIPNCFKLYNDGYMYGDLDQTRFHYKFFIKEDSRANNCIQCRACEEKCPQKIPISEWMPKVHSVLGEGQPYNS